MHRYSRYDITPSMFVCLTVWKLIPDAGRTFLAMMAGMNAVIFDHSTLDSQERPWICSSCSA